MRTVAIVSPHFPPSNLAGVHRARHLANHLPAHGWRPIVVRVDERHYTELGDIALSAMVSQNVEQICVNAIPAKLGRIVGIGDIGLRGYFSIRQTIAKLAARSRPDVLLFTGAPFYPMLLSSWVRKRLKIPVVLDFQDPWVSAEGATRPRLTKRGISHQIAIALEPLAVRYANFITSVSERQNIEMAARYPWFDSACMAAIPIGGDPEDFKFLREHAPVSPIVQLDSKMINLSYVGTFMPRTGPLARTVLRALARLKWSHPELAANLRVNFVGTSNQPNCDDVFKVRPIAEEEGVGELVNETPQRVPFLEALGLLANSSGLILIGSDEPHYTASKIYPALMSGRPFVSLFHRQSSAHQILRDAGGGRTFSFATAEELEALTEPLSEALLVLATMPEAFGRANVAAFGAYTADGVAAAFEKVLDAAVADHLQ